MPGRRYIVQQGDTLSKIAATSGLGSWRTLYDHADNAAFKKRRPNPNLILPGDELVIPDLTERGESRSTEQRHAFVVRREGLRVRVRLKDTEGNALAGAPYRLVINGAELHGTTESDGLVDQPLPTDASDGDLILNNGSAMWKLLFGHLDPLRDPATGEAIISGVQARLKNLGFAAGPTDGVVGPATSRAIARFQRQTMNRADADGTLDTETIDAIEQAHGC